MSLKIVESVFQIQIKNIFEETTYQRTLKNMFLKDQQLFYSNIFSKYPSNVTQPNNLFFFFLVSAIKLGLSIKENSVLPRTIS